MCSPGAKEWGARGLDHRCAGGLGRLVIDCGEGGDGIVVVGG